MNDPKPGFNFAYGPVDQDSCQQQQQQQPSQSRNGRLQILRQVSLTWLSALIALISFVLTVKYAITGSLGPGALWLQVSSSRAILLLRLLSELTSLFFFILISSVLDLLQWILVSRERGVDMPTLLTIEAGTGVLGLMQLLLFNGSRWVTRLSSFGRLVVKALVPALGVLIMSNVETSLTPDDSRTFSFPVTAGLGEFNISKVAEVDSVLGYYFMTDVSNFLQNDQHARPTEPVWDRKEFCPNSTSFNGCSASYVINGGLDGVSPWPDIYHDRVSKNEDLIVVERMRSLQLDFTAQNSSVQCDFTRDCRVFATDREGIVICAWPADNSESYDAHAVNARFRKCPIDVSVNQSCLSNTTWQTSDHHDLNISSTTELSSTMFSITSIEVRTAFSRYNRSIVAHEWSDDDPYEPFKVAPQDLLSVYETAFNSSAHNPSGAASSNDFFLKYLYHSITVGSRSATGTDGISYTLANLLALPFWYFQANDPFLTGRNRGPNPRTDIPETAFLGTVASFSHPSYRIYVGHLTVIIYTVGGAAVLLFCITVVLLGSLPKFTSECPRTTQWPAYDFAAHSEIRSTTSGVVDDLRGTQGLRGRRLRAALTDKRVMRV